MLLLATIIAWSWLTLAIFSTIDYWYGARNSYAHVNVAIDYGLMVSLHWFRLSMLVITRRMMRRAWEIRLFVQYWRNMRATIEMRREYEDNCQWCRRFIAGLELEHYSGNSLAGLQITKCKYVRKLLPDDSIQPWQWQVINNEGRVVAAAIVTIALFSNIHFWKEMALILKQRMTKYVTISKYEPTSARWWNKGHFDTPKAEYCAAKIIFDIEQ